MNDQQHSFLGSLKWAFYMTWADRAFAVLFTFLLAAILGPRDFGIVALALIYIAVVQLLLEGGIQTAVVQREGLEDPLHHERRLAGGGGASEEDDPARPDLDVVERIAEGPGLGRLPRQDVLVPGLEQIFAINIMRVTH